MWAPGTYLPDRDEGDAVHANIGVEKYFFAAGDQILNRIKDVRGTVILPERTGPIADVLYSAAGNSADEHWYNRDVIAYSFETGADRYVNTTLSVASAAGDTGIRAANRTRSASGDTIKVDFGTANEEVSRSSRSPSEPAEPAAEHHPGRAARLPRGGRGAPGGGTSRGGRLPANVRHGGEVRGARVRRGQLRLLESAYEYEKDAEPPQVRMTGTTFSSGPALHDVRVRQRAVGHPLHDRRSKPNENSTLWDSTGPRSPARCSTSPPTPRSAGWRRTSRATCRSAPSLTRSRPSSP